MTDDALDPTAAGERLDPPPAGADDAAGGARTSSSSSSGAADARRLDVRAIYAEHGEYVWSSLQRLGVREADLEDMAQEVFVVVYQRLHTFDGTARMTTWLFGICVRVAAAHRRRAYVAREQATDAVPEPTPPQGVLAEPETALAERQARAQLDAILDALDLEKRAVFVMFELEEMSCEDIAAELGVPVGTVYSRLHAARKAFARALARWQASQRGRASAAGGGGA